MDTVLDEESATPYVSHKMYLTTDPSGRALTNFGDQSKQAHPVVNTTPQGLLLSSLERKTCADEDR
jgi:hypothetical protein